MKNVLWKTVILRKIGSCSCVFVHDMRLQEVEYRLRLTPAPDDDTLYHHEDLPEDEPDDNFTVDQVKRDFAVDISESQT